MATGNDPAGMVPNLAIVSADQSPTAPGGAFALLAHFHAYAINPAKPGEAVNLQGAQDLLGFLTSPSVQVEIKNYLATAPHSPGAPFVSDAAPALTATPSATSVAAGASVTVSGSVSDPEPGYPGLAGQPVAVRAVGGTPLASGLVDAHGGYSIAFDPPASGTYEIATSTISRLIEPGAAPPFGDQLAPAASAPFSLTVTGEEGVRIAKVRVKKGLVTVTGNLDSPAQAGAALTLLASRTGTLAHAKRHRKRTAASRTKAKAPKKVAKLALKAGASAFTIKHRLPRGFRYALSVSYAAPGQSAVASKPKRVAVP
jgi:hypothetical protein